MTGGFNNPIVGGEDILIREAIQSPNFQAGVSGWRVARDGTVEFNSGTFRGSVDIGDTIDGQVMIDNEIPAILASYYSGIGSLSAANIRLQPDGSGYFYLVSGLNAGSGLPFFAEGHVPPGAAVAADVCQVWYSFLDPATSIGQVNIGDVTKDFRVLVNSNFTQFGNGLSGNVVVDGNLAVAGIVSVAGTGDVDITEPGDIEFVNGAGTTIVGGRGIVFSDRILVAVNSGAVAGAETEVYNTGNIRFAAFRTFKVTLINAKLKSAVVQQPTLRLRKTNVVGTLLVATPPQTIPVINQDAPVESTMFIFKNSTGAVVTAPLSLTLAPSVATLVTLDSGGVATLGWWILVEDITNANGVVGGVSV